jgi:hypothetical protein
LLELLLLVFYVGKGFLVAFAAYLEVARLLGDLAQLACDF